MAIKYKFDVLKELKAGGYSTYTLIKEKLIPDGTVHRLRHNELVSLATINTICRLLELQPGDILEYVPDKEKEGDHP